MVKALAYYEPPDPIVASKNRNTTFSEENVTPSQGNDNDLQQPDFIAIQNDISNETSITSNKSPLKSDPPPTIHNNESSCNSD